jgi:hypothetical protein
MKLAATVLDLLKCIISDSAPKSKKNRLPEGRNTNSLSDVLPAAKVLCENSRPAARPDLLIFCFPACGFRIRTRMRRVFIGIRAFPDSPENRPGIFCKTAASKVPNRNWNYIE